MPATRAPAAKAPARKATRVRAPATRAVSASSRSAETAVIDTINSRYLETLMGYNARRAALSIISVFLERMAVYDLKPVEFSVLSLVLHNPGITSRQLCAALNILPPNLVGLVQSLVKRGLIVRMPHPHDGRAMGLHPTQEGAALMTKAEKTASQLELDVTKRLSADERSTLLSLLQKIYL
ncbi:MAG: winged helix-turn-helix transcriptional regulator [Limnohabitans sp.]|jgi:DNA-binding MarR family transcriptional regulator|nr:winged helix-turn-helix transcriptional regulator [Limnohabitans sp.]